MTAQSQIYKCNICGNIVEILHLGAGELICCGQSMIFFKENTADASLEKHMPVVERAGQGIKVKVGSITHPMEEKHYIEWIEIIRDGRICKKFLKPGDIPEVWFEGITEESGVRAYCNLHGLWKSL